MAIEMPAEVTQTLFDLRNVVWTFTLTALGGAAGGYGAVVLTDLDPTRPPLTPRQVRATLFLGVIMSIGFSSVLGTFIDVPFIKTLPIVTTAILAGFLGKPLAKRLDKLSVYLGGKEEVHE